MWVQQLEETVQQQEQQQQEVVVVVGTPAVPRYRKCRVLLLQQQR
jgi:hypothetical protein